MENIIRCVDIPEFNIDVEMFKKLVQLDVRCGSVVKNDSIIKEDDMYWMYFDDVQEVCVALWNSKYCPVGLEFGSIPKDFVSTHC